MHFYYEIEIVKNFTCKIVVAMRNSRLVTAPLATRSNTLYIVYKNQVKKVADIFITLLQSLILRSTTDQ